MGYNHLIILYAAIFIVCIALFNAFGLAVTKYASAAQRSTIDCSRIFAVWMLSLWIFHDPFMPLEIIGFMMLVLGTLMYNEIIIIPYLGFN